MLPVPVQSSVKSSTNGLHAVNNYNEECLAVIEREVFYSIMKRCRSSQDIIKYNFERMDFFMVPRGEKRIPFR